MALSRGAAVLAILSGMEVYNLCGADFKHNKHRDIVLEFAHHAGINAKVEHCR